MRVTGAQSRLACAACWRWPCAGARSGCSSARAAAYAGRCAGAGGARDQRHAESPSASATSKQCVTSVVQSERSATFVGEMTRDARHRCACRCASTCYERLRRTKRVPHDRLPRPRRVARSAAGRQGRITYLKQVTDLSAPAVYRAAVRFRWLNSKGRVIRDDRTLRTDRAASSRLARPVTSTPPAEAGTSTSATQQALARPPRRPRGSR